MLQWCLDNGAVIPPTLSPKEIEPGNTGVFTSASEATIKLPSQLIITAKTAAESLGAFAPENQLLKLYLAKARSEKVFHSPYIDSLPTLAQINTPFVWSPEEKALLKGSNLGNSLRDHLTQIVDEWFEAISAIPEHVPKPQEHFANIKFYYEYKFYTEDDLHKYLLTADNANWTAFYNYLWASQVLKSRAFPAYIMDQSASATSLMLLPFVDLLNHSPSAKVEWRNEGDFFVFCSKNLAQGEVFNNYGMKGNEELLLGYGFTIEDNAADTAALKIKIPEEMQNNMVGAGITLPKMTDYTYSVVETPSSEAKESVSSSSECLFFVSRSHVPENLLEVFSFLVKNKLDSSHRSLRAQFAGLNHLRQALEQKQGLIVVPAKGNPHAITYLSSQKQVFSGAIKVLKRHEKEMLAQHKEALLTLKSAYKNDVPLQQGLLVGFGATSWDDIVDAHLQDQSWLLYLIRCYNRDVLETNNSFLPKWIEEVFAKMMALPVSNEEVVQYRQIYEGLVPPLVNAVPEVFGRGKWTVEVLIAATRVLDCVGFVRGKEQESILVEDAYFTG